MSKPVRSFLSFLLVLQLIIPFSASAAAIGEFSKVVGGVTQTRAQQVITPVMKSPIELKDIIITDQASSAIMVFSDDSTIKLDQNSKLEVKEFLFKDKARTGIFALATGKLTATVRKFIGDDNLFEVHSPTSVAGVRGTGFEFTESMVGGKPTATITCTEGSLTISALSPAGVIVATSVITAGMTAVVSGGVITAATTMAGIMGTAATAVQGMSTAQTLGVVAAGLAGGGVAVAAGTAASGDRGKNTVSYSDNSIGSSPQTITDLTPSTSLEGSWYFTEQAFSSWYMNCSLSANSVAICNECLSSSSCISWPGTWSFTASSLDFSLVPSGVGGSMGGTISGSTSNFYVSGHWADGASARFHCVRR
jgi:hypothetical protein